MSATIQVEFQGPIEPVQVLTAGDEGSRQGGESCPVQSAGRPLTVYNILVIGSIGSEAEADPAGFERAVRSAAQRLDDIERGEAEEPASRNSIGQKRLRRQT